MKIVLEKYSRYILTASLFILGLSLGFFGGRSTQLPIVAELDTNIPSSSETPIDFYSSQTATIRGIITKRDGDTLTVKNLNTQVTGNIKTAAKIVILDATSKQGTASPSADLSKIKLDKEVFITLETINNHYEATIIQYVVPAPSLPPLLNASQRPSPSTKP